MKKSLAPLIGIAFVVAIISTGVFYGLFVTQVSGNVTSEPARPVVVAALDLERGKVLTAGDVKVVNWSAEAPKGSLSRLEQVHGLTLIAPVAAHEPLTGSRVASAKTGAGAALGIPAGMRAASVHVVDSSGVIKLLEPGHRVDVQVVHHRDGQEPELRTVLENISVWSVHREGEVWVGRQAVPVVTLLATPEEVDLLGLADAAARIRLVLRNPLDEGRKRRPGGVGLSRIMRGTGGTAAGQAPPAGKP